MLGVEEFDEALQEVRTLLHVAFPGSQQILGKEQHAGRAEAEAWGHGAAVPIPG